MTGRYKAYPEYKESNTTELGCIPSHWKTSKVRYLSYCLDGKRIPLNGSERSEMQGSIPYWGANSIVDYVNNYIFDEDLILLGEDGAPFFDATRNVAFFVQGKVWPNNHVHVLRPRKDKVKAQFLAYALNCVDYHLYITGSTRDKLNQSAMNDIALRLPTYEEQQKITNFLDHEIAKIDTLIAKQEKLIKLLKEKRQAVISHAVTKGLNSNAPMKDSGVEWLGEVPEHWLIGSLRWRISISSGEGLSSNLVEKNKTELKTIPVIGGNGIMGFAESSNTHKTAIAIGRVGALCGNVHLINYISWITDNALKISSWDGFNEDYLINLLKAANLNNLASTTAQPLITGEQVKSLRVVVPPLKEQIKINLKLTETANLFDKLEKRSKEAINLLKERKTALISAAVTGKIDVRDWEVE